MGRVTGLGARLIFGSLLVYIFVSFLGASGPFGGMAGMLVSRFPFHRQIAEAFAEGLGYDISMISAVYSSIVDDLIVLLLSVALSGGISTTLGHIFSPDGKVGIQGMAVSALSLVVTVCVASFLFGGIVQWMNQSLGGRLLLPVLKVLILVVSALVFIAFVQACAGLARGEVGLGLLGFFAIRSVIETVVADVAAVYIILTILNRAGAVAGTFTAVYIVATLVLFVVGSLGRAAS